MTSASTYRPVPGKITVEMVQNRICTVTSYGTDSTGEYVEHLEAAEICDSGFLVSRFLVNRR